MGEEGPQAPRLTLCCVGYSNGLRARREEGKWECAVGNVGWGDTYRGTQPRADWYTKATLQKFA